MKIRHLYTFIIAVAAVIFVSCGDFLEVSPDNRALVDTDSKIIQEIYSGKLNHGQHFFKMNINSLISGIYFVNLKWKNIVESKKILILK